MKYTFLFLILLNLSVSLFSDWICYYEKCYLLSQGDDRLSWENARAACVSNGWDLVSIHTQEEQTFLEGLDPRNVWIGLFLNPEGKYIWTDGSDLNFTDWYPGRPTAYGCVVIDSYLTWWDIGCDTLLPYICEHTLHNGNCTDLIAGQDCRCDAGYTGQNCETEIDECVSSPCGNGTCEDELNGFRCTCFQGYTGTICDIDIDECLSSPCINGTCQDSINGFRCICIPGYTGTVCDLDINDCESSPCIHGICEDLVDAFMCNCYLGYSGVYCQHGQQGSNLSRLQSDLILPIVIPLCLLALVILFNVIGLAIAIRISRRRLNVKENAVQPFNERSEDGPELVRHGKQAQL